MVREKQEEHKSPTINIHQNLNHHAVKGHNFIFIYMKRNIKDKLFELKITDDMEDESGIDSISLVDTPAIEVNWIAFSKEREHEFHIPDGEDDSYLDRLTPYGQDEQLLFDEGFEIMSIEYQHKNEFIYSFPNRESDLDTNFFRIRYKYMLNPQAGGQPITATTRKFCADLIRKNLVFRLEDMLNQQNEQGDSFADWRGGYNCRHIFAKIIYKKKGEIENYAGGKREDGYDILGDTQNDTRTSNPSFSQEKMAEDSISDYPDSVKNNAKAVLKYVEENGWGSCGTPVGKQRANQLAKGEPISRETVKRMYSYLSRHKGDLDSSKGYGDGCGKIMYDSWGGLSALRWAESKVNTFGLNVGGLPSYVDELPKKKRKTKFEEETGDFDYLKVSKDVKQSFSTDEEKRTVIGPAMIPDMNIIRKDIFGNPYYVFFSEDTIKMIAEKYMKNKYLDNNDLMHDGKAVNDVYVVESWIVEDPETDKSNKYGYNLPKGTWMVMMKCSKTPKGDEVWNKIKSKELNGFSVSGYFLEEAANFRDELFLKKVVEILKNIK